MDALTLAYCLASFAAGYLAGRPFVQRRRYRLSARAWWIRRFPRSFI